MTDLRCRTTIHYGTIEHFFILISLIFAFILNDMLSGTAFIVKNYASTRPSVIHVFWIIVFYLFVIQCWWGTLRSRSVLNNNFTTICILIFQPILLYILAVALFPEKSDVNFNYSIYFSETFHIIYLIAATNFLYLILLNKYLIKTIHYTEENIIRFGVMASLVALVIFGFLIKNLYNDYFSYVKYFQIGHILLCGVALVAFIKKFRKTISDYESLDPDGFLNKIMPCAIHSFRRGDGFAFIIVKMKKLDESLYEKINRIVRLHDEKCVYCNFIFIYMSLPEYDSNGIKYDQIDLIEKRLNSVRSHLECKRFIEYGIYNRDRTCGFETSGNEIAYTSKLLREEVRSFFFEIFERVGTHKCF